MKNNLRRVSTQTLQNWLLDSFLLITMVAVTLSGIYFLFFPSGFQGGRNPYFHMKILFERESWDLIHTWTGVVIIIAIIVHILLHWNWVVNVPRRYHKLLTCRGSTKNPIALLNLIVDVLAAVLFLMTAVSGIVLLFLPGGRMTSQIVMLYLTKSTWDIIHTWSGIGVIILVVVHLIIHWCWVRKVTHKILSRNHEAPDLGLTETN
ncbi:MAG TPA: DUF4405 domain-containing protein [Anaerolineae bacterium]|nr:DUF4405 domain-containing protein [Anaerolineae bacterium]